ncbi:ATP-dependent DNA helicase RecG [Candidatus Uhrbacteria bacterium]|nr:ATP-dependent DNA helicase RecG [Candidatus Uhrbacteria bacterium]
MAFHLASPIGDLPGIGSKAQRDFKALGLKSLRDLLFYVPFRYDDYSTTRPLARVRAGEPVTVTGTITSITSHPSKNKKMTLVEAMLEDETGTLPIVWFNQPYLVQTIRPGTTLSLAGTVDFRYKRAMVNPLHEPAGTQVLTGRIVPVYGLSGSLKMHRVRTAMRSALSAAHELVDWLPSEIKEEMPLPDLQTAVRSIHFPESKEALDRAIERFKFDELFLHQLMFACVRRERKAHSAFEIPLNRSTLQTFVASLPFSITQAQRRAAWEIVQDLTKPHPMNRLLQGDVGSGKTVVSAIAASGVIRDKHLVVYLAPTELLCAQQYQAFCRWFPEEKIALFTRSQKVLSGEALGKEDLIERLRAGEVRVVIGTHALFEQTVELPQLALVIIDEQQRFGVAQRHALLEKIRSVSPHLLSMTATPIPRSLALTIYGDLDVSLIDEMPVGRRPVGTAVVPHEHHEAMWTHVKSQIEQGHQAYVVCPLIDPSDVLGSKSVTEMRAQLGKGSLMGARLGVLHGKLKSEERLEVIEDFRGGRLDAVISTTVVEVGVDVPNATVMVITGAERFGLAQLHQLRGRVGRSDLPSFCYLLPNQTTALALERLRCLEKTHDGFALAQKDLQLRGSGNVFGSAQSGFPDFKLATEADMDLMKKAHDICARLLQTQTDFLETPLIAEQLSVAFEAVHLE